MKALTGSEEINSPAGETEEEQREIPTGLKLCGERE